MRLQSLRTPIRHFTRVATTMPKLQLPTTPAHPWPRPQDWPAAKVRQTFIDYFKTVPGLEHTFWPSAGVVPFEDETLLFVNAVGCCCTSL